MNTLKETIRVERLTTGYTGRNGSKVAVTGSLSASLHGGELTCLLGPNGAGKSTLLRTLSGFLPPLDGEIFIEGKRLSAHTPAELAKVIGVVLTERLHLNNMTVEELVGLGRSPYTGFWGRLSGDDRRIVNRSMELVRVDGMRGRMVSTLSDGERQKVMIAKALAQETPVIFLDEPTAFLDYPSKVEIMQLLLSLARGEGKTVFLSTHDLELSLQIADRIWLVDKEKGVVTGTPEDLSLAGEMGRFFEREGVVFDLDAGLFRIDSRTEREIGVTGEGARLNMVRKALFRCGIRATDQAGSAGMIEVKPDSYTYKGHTVLTIEELLSLIE